MRRAALVLVLAACKTPPAPVVVSDAAVIEPAPVATKAMAPTSKIVEVQTKSSAFLCARYENGKVRCGGNNVFGQLGSGARAADNVLYRPTETTSIETVDRIAVGTAHACVLLPTGAVRCWGSDLTGELGNNDAGIVPAPVDVVGVNDAVDVTAGNATTCAIRKDRTVVCWGYNHEGQVGDGTGHDALHAVPVKGVANVDKLALGFRASCALHLDATVTCWGLLGGKSGEPKRAPVSGVKLLAVMQDGGACVYANDAVSCWGGNGFPDTPKKVEGLTDVLALDGNNHRTCALLRSGKVSCFGADDPPKDVAGITNAVALTAGGPYCCALTSDNKVVCPGENPLGPIASLL